MRLPPLLAALAAAVTLALSAPAHAYEAPWSNIDFLQDQRWSQINNRLANQNLANLRRSVGLGNRSSSRSSSKSSTTSATQKGTQKSAPAVEDRSVLELGEAASTDLAPLRPYLATTQLSEEQAAKVLAMYNQVAYRLDVPFNDSASGIAAFLAGSYSAYTNKPFPDELYKPLYEQFASSMSTGSSLKKMPLATRTEYYQRLVVAGMLYQLLQLDLQADPDPGQIAMMRTAAGKAFKELSGRAPDSIHFTRQGLLPR